MIGDRLEHDELIGARFRATAPQTATAAAPRSRIVDLKNTLHEMRLVKDEAAILSMRAGRAP
ncbi:MAG: hypothetical protein U0787_07020 [Polyangia bacterium]